jgi:hypothetical protein
MWSPSITQVCRFWRLIALGTPAVWNHLDLARPDLAAALCNRFLKHPLHLSSSLHGIPEVGYETAIQIIVTEALRISELRITSHQVIEAAFAHLPHYMSELRVLAVKSHTTDSYRHINRLQCPNLQYLRLFKTEPSVWTTPLLLQSLKLRHLDISRFSPTPPPHFPSVINALHNLRLLETLKLTWQGPVKDLLTPPAQPVHLPHLQKLKIFDGGVGCTNLRRHLLLSQEVEINLEIVFWPGYPAYFRELIEQFVSPYTHELLFASSVGRYGRAHVVACMPTDWERLFTRYQPSDQKVLTVGRGERSTFDTLMHTTAVHVGGKQSSSKNSAVLTCTIGVAILADYSGIHTLRLSGESAIIAMLELIQGQISNKHGGLLISHVKLLIIENISNPAYNSYAWIQVLRDVLAERRRGTIAGTKDLLYETTHIADVPSNTSMHTKDDMSQGVSRLQTLLFVRCTGIDEGILQSFREMIPKVACY